MRPNSPQPGPPQSLLVLVDAIDAECSLTYDSAQHYRAAAKRFGAFLGQSATTEELTVHNVNAWLRALEAELSPVTVQGYKRSILRIWNYAASLDVTTPYQAKRIRRVRMPDPEVRPLTTAEVQRLLTAAASIPGRMKNCGTPRRVVLDAIIRLGFESGLRQRDLHRVTLRQLSEADRTLRVIQNKTGKRHIVRLSPDTFQAVAACLNHPDRSPAGGPHLVSSKERAFAKLKRRVWTVAGLPDPCAFSRLRKSFATAIAERDGLEVAARALGHVSGTLIARKWYVSAETLFKPVEPPTIDGEAVS